MELTDVNFNKKRDFSDVLNVTFGFLRQEFKPFYTTIITYTIVPLIAVAIISVFANVNSLSNTFQNIFENNPEAMEPNLLAFFLLIVVSLIAQVMVMGMTYEYMILYKREGRGNFTGADVFNGFVKHFLGIVGFSFLAGIIVFFAFLFFLIPGIYISVVLSLLIIVKMNENAGFSTSWGRSFQLIKNNWWLTFGLLIVAYIILYMISIVFSIPAAIFGVATGLTMAAGEAESISKVALTAVTLISTLGQSWTYCIVYLVIGSHYFSLDANENSDTLMDRINKIGESTDNAL